MDSVIAIVTIEGLSPLSQSIYVPNEKKPKESQEEYDLRIWEKKAEFNKDGKLVLHQMAFRKSLETAGSRLGIKIKGKGSQTYTKCFRSGILILEKPICNVGREEMKMTSIYMPIDKKGTRLMLNYPIWYKWECTIELTILDTSITKDVLIQHVEEAGAFTGLGRWRPERGGVNGRFRLKDLEWIVNE